MTFIEHYKELKRMERPKHPAKVFIENMANLTGRSQKTIYQWLSGIQKPPMDVRLKISEDLGSDPDELFPSM